MVRSPEAEELFGVELEETPDTLSYGLSGDFASQVMDELERQGITLAELARRMGIKQPTLCGMLRGTSNMTLKTIARMALALGCTLEAPRLVIVDEPASPSRLAKVVPFDALEDGRRRRAEVEALQA